MVCRTCWPKTAAVLVSKSVAIEKDRATLCTLITMLFCDHFGERT